jgi:hypothetical protein
VAPRARMARTLVESLETNAGVLNLIVLKGVARNPDGDAVQFDLITAEANRGLMAQRRLWRRIAARTSTHTQRPRS